MPGLIKILLRLFSFLPLRANHGIGQILGLIYYHSSKRGRHVCQINIERCFPHLQQNRRQDMIKDCFAELGKTVTEIGPMWFWSKSKILTMVTKVSGKEHLDQAMERGHGAIIAAPHLGCWEVVGTYCSNLYPMTTLYRPPRIVQLENFVRHARLRHGANLAATNTKGIRQLYAVLSRGELVGILPDQDPGKRGSGQFVPFFGQMAKTMVLLIKLAKKNQAKIIFTFAERLPKGKGFHIHFIPADEALINLPLTQALTKMNQGVEQCIKQFPTQYQWTYKRFRSRPEGEASFY